jgi:diguanylate cyclase (GGDEF)-like protein
MKYDIISILNQNEFYIDYIVYFEEKLYRMRKLESFHFLNLDIISKFEGNFKSLKEYGLIYPEKINLKSKKPELFYIYREENNLFCQKSEKAIVDSIAYFFYILDDLVHFSNFIPSYINLDDFFIDHNKNFYFFAPILRNISNEKIFLIKEQFEDNLISSLIEFIKYLNFNIKLNSIQKLFRDIEDKKNISCVSQFKNYFQIKNKRKFKKVQFTGRKELLEELYQKINSNENLLQEILFWGEQRTGKTTVLNLIIKKLKFQKNFKVLNVKKYEDIFCFFGSKKNDLLDLINRLKDLSKENEYLIIIDEYQNKRKKIDEIIDIIKKSNLKIPINIIYVTHGEISNKKFDMNYNISGLSLKETYNLLSTMTDNKFLNENSYFSKELYNYSKGYPGIIIKTMTDLYNSNILRYDDYENKWIIKDKFIFDKNIDVNFSLLKVLDKKSLEELKYISILGYTFSIMSLKKLEKILLKKFDINIFLNYEIIQLENGVYRFFNMKYRDYFYSKLEKEIKLKIHNDMYLLENDFELSIWHLEQINRKEKIVAEYTKKIKKYYFDWNNLELIKPYFKEIVDNGYYNETAICIYVDYMIYSENFVEAKKYINKLKSNFTKYYKLKFYSEIDPDIAIIELKNEFANKSITDYQKILYLEVLLKANINKNNSSINKNIFKKIKKIYRNNSKNNNFTRSYIRSLINLSDYYSYDKINCLKYLNEALNISNILKENKYKGIIILKMTRFQIENPAYYDSLIEDSIGIFRNSNDLSKFPEIYFNKAYISLYKGNIDDFFYNVNESLKFSRIINNRIVEIQCYSLKALYYFYSEDEDNFYFEIRKIKYYKNLISLKEKDKQTYYIFYLELLNSIYKRDKKVNINNFDYYINEKYSFFKNIWEIYTSEDENKIYKNFVNTCNGDVNIEESIFLLYYKFINIKEDNFVYNIEKVIKKFKENGYKLSLALVYEGLSNFYKVKKDTLRAFKYYRLSVLAYKNMGMSFKINILSRNFVDFIENVNESLKYNINYNEIKDLKFYDDLINISTKIISMDNVQEILDAILNFIKKKFPISDIYIKVDTEIFEAQSTTSYEMLIPNNEKLSITPFEIFFISNYKDYSIKYYLKNENLLLNLKIFENIFDTLIILDDYLSGTLNRIIHQQNSIQDYLTGAYSRRYLYLRLKEEFIKAKREELPLSLIMLDIDDFKKINDTYGHKKGDEILKAIVRDLNMNLRITDIIGRYGGEEFIIILPKTDIVLAYDIAERLRKSINERVSLCYGFEVSASFGISTKKNCENIDDYRVLIERADIASYISKSRGKNTVSIFSKNKDFSEIDDI